MAERWLENSILNALFAVLGIFLFLAALQSSIQELKPIAEIKTYVGTVDHAEIKSTRFSSHVHFRIRGHQPKFVYSPVLPFSLEAQSLIKNGAQIEVICACGEMPLILSVRVGKDLIVNRSEAENAYWKNAIAGIFWAIFMACVSIVSGYISVKNYLRWRDYKFNQIG